MPKITLIGAGSVVFTRNLCSDFLLTPALQDCTISLMDIDPGRLEQARALVQAIVDRRGLAAKIEAYAIDIEVPERYGVGQCVGDTLGPGGVFRSLRTIPVLIDLCADLDDLAPDALLLNYVNPMAANCWAVHEATGRPYVGLCHSVQGTSQMLARWIDVPYEEVAFYCAGINHQAWFLEYRRGGTDLYPLIWEATQRAETYGEEPVRIDMMRHFGYFVTESSGHASEYVPYFRKNPEMIENELVPRFTNEADHWLDFGRTGGYLRHCHRRLGGTQQDYEELREGVRSLPTERTHEYGWMILEAMELDRPARVNGNVPNYGLIDNLPEGCCVEVPCLVDANGIQPTKVGLLPPQLAALNRTQVNVQELIVEASLSGNPEAVHYAVALDPLTAAVCTLPQIRAMVDEMLEAQARWLPQFRC